MQVIILITPLSKFFIVSNINMKYIFITLIICLLMFVVGELSKPVYTKLFKDYKGGKNNE